MNIKVNETHEKRKLAKRALQMSLFALTGIVLPIGALLTEFFLGLSRSVFFDPIPSTGHIVLIGIVPATNYLLLRIIRKQSTRVNSALFLNGVVLAISFVYAILFLPVLPFAAMYTAFSMAALFIPALITILPFAPLFSFTCGLTSYFRLRNLDNSHSRLYSSAGFLAGLAALVIVEAPRAVTTYSLEILANDPTNARAIAAIRNYGDTALVLSAAYGDSMVLKDFRTWLSGMTSRRHQWDIFERQTTEIVQPSLARTLYYQVTGASFNSLPRPRRAQNASFLGWNNDLGSNAVGGKTDHVRLMSSVLDGSLSGQTMTSYVEWTLVFRNDNTFFQEEARAEIALPPGGVVSRATLWINDQEVEALLGSREDARKAYERVVSQRRDPLLVTTAGPDRILVQCFPIPPKGGEMKIRLGITSPIVPVSFNEGKLRLPDFVATNFRQDASLRHLLWLESREEFHTSMPELIGVSHDGDTYRAQGNVGGNEHKLDDILLSTPLTVSNSSVTSSNGGQLIGQELSESRFPTSNEVVLIIDGSKRTKAFLSDLVSALRPTLANKRALVLFAGDAVEPLSRGFVQMTESEIDKLLGVIRQLPYEGGADPVAAIRDAWNMSTAFPHAPIVWIHSLKPVRSMRSDIIEQYARRVTNPRRIISIPLEIDSDRFDEQLQEFGLLEKLPLSLAFRPLTEQLMAVIDGSPYFNIQRKARVRPEGDHSPEYGHINRLWALDEISNLLTLNARTPEKNATLKDEALKLALDYRLVTPISGAVVLEKQDALTANNLAPGEGGKIPAVPEPHMVYLLLVTSVVLALYRQQMTARKERS